jgi:hypothetical protein
MATSRQAEVDISVGNMARYVDWAAIFAGAVLASAISFVLFTFGTGIGLSLTSPYPGESVNITAFAIALGLWVLWVSTSSFIAGAYLTGRLRRRIGDATEHEVEVRDAAHGLLVWALSVLIGALIAALVSAGVAAKTADVAGSAVAGATAAAVQEADDPTGYWSDFLFRPGGAAAAAEAPAATTTAETTAPATTTTGQATTTTGQATTTTAPAATPPASTGPAAPPAPAATAEREQRAAERIMASRIADGKLPDDDRAYLTRVVMNNTGLGEEDARARVDQALTGLSEARAQAQELAEKARKFGILVTFLTAASLAVGAWAAWWASTLGGNHRDQATDFSHFFGRSRI